MSSPGPQRNLWRAVWVGVVVVQIAYAFAAPYLDPFLRVSVLHGDARMHDGMAWRLAAHGRLVFLKGLQTAPAYVYLLAGVYKVFGHSVLAGRVMNSLLQLVACAGVWRCAKALYDERVANWSVVAVTFNPYVTLLRGWLYTENLALPLLVWAIVLLWQARRTWQTISAGVLFGLLALTRANYLPIAALAVVWMLRYGAPPSGDSASAGAPQRSRLRAAAILAAAIAITLAPYVSYVSLRFHRPVAIASGGFVLFWANNPEADGGFTDPPDHITLGGKDVDVNAYTDADNAVDSDRLYAHLAVQWIEENPGAFARLLVKKTLLTLTPMGLQHSENRSIVAGASTTLLEFVALPFYVAFLILAQWAAAAEFRLRARELSFLAALWAVTWAVIWAYAGGVRMLVPVMPLLSLFFVQAVIRLGSRKAKPA